MAARSLSISSNFAGTYICHCYHWRSMATLAHLSNQETMAKEAEKEIRLLGIIPSGLYIQTL
ncbi:hypothetical protein [Rhodocytophaga aerolata]|uniref:hypothetical protein n=1 Tax=Rhodocytophaga aerolata TaxID=455078 RepID=UPI00366FD975